MAVLPSFLVKGLATVPKTGRNQPCPCGSGKKYKHCCLAKDEAAELAKLAAKRAELQAQHDQYCDHSEGFWSAVPNDYDGLEHDSNAVIDLVKAGRLDEAERAARELLARYPEVHDGYDRLGMVYEARGDNKQAANCYRKVVEFVRARPDHYEPGYESIFVALVDQLDPPAAN
jgi:tetratricopeptide (TPR) repeat protein